MRASLAKQCASVLAVRLCKLQVGIGELIVEVNGPDLLLQHGNNSATFKDRLIAGGFAGCMSTFLLYPLELLQTRLTVHQTDLCPAAVGTARDTLISPAVKCPVCGVVFRGVLDSTIAIVRNEGVKALYVRSLPLWHLLGFVQLQRLCTVGCRSCAARWHSNGNQIGFSD